MLLVLSVSALLFIAVMNAA